MWHKTMSQYCRLLYFQTYREDDFSLFSGGNFMPVHCIKSKWIKLPHFQVLYKMLSEEIHKETSRFRKWLPQIRNHHSQQSSSCRTVPRQFPIPASEYARWTWKKFPVDLKEGWRPLPAAQTVFGQLLFQSILYRTEKIDSYVGNTFCLLIPPDLRR